MSPAWLWPRNLRFQERENRWLSAGWGAGHMSEPPTATDPSGEGFRKNYERLLGFNSGY